MGKRSAFKRRPQDAYDTPMDAVFPLARHVPNTFLSFWEPCAGKGDLTIALCFLAEETLSIESDIEPRCPDILARDALSGYPNLQGVDYIITNPPWTRSILHPMIEHFSDMRPTWLLFDADWVHTKQAIPYLPRLRKIVSVGRVKWIKDSPHTGKDNCAWHLFDKPSNEPPEFYGRVG